jgi:hypothetical protein
MNKVWSVAAAVVLVGILVYFIGVPVHGQKKQTTAASNGLVVKKGIVSDGEKVPLPGGLSPEDVTILLSLWEIDDHAQIAARIHCYLEEDGLTARVRSVAKHTMRRDPKRAEKGKQPVNPPEQEVVARGKATYLIIKSK